MIKHIQIGLLLCGMVGASVFPFFVQAQDVSTNNTNWIVNAYTQAATGNTSPTAISGSATPAEIQAQIQSLTAELQTLQQQLTAAEAQSSWCYNFTGNLQVGATGAAVAALQAALQKDGETVSMTGTFDDQTASAVTGFQQKYASSILTPANLQNGLGYVNAATVAALNRLYGCGAGTMASASSPAITTPATTGSTPSPASTVTTAPNVQPLSFLIFGFPNPLSFSLQPGAQAMQSFIVTNNAGTPINITATASWLALGTPAGSASGPAETVPVTANSCNLAAGTYTGSVVIGAAGTLVEIIPVSLTVAGPNATGGCGGTSTSAGGSGITPPVVSSTGSPSSFNFSTPAGSSVSQSLTFTTSQAAGVEPIPQVGTTTVAVMGVPGVPSDIPPFPWLTVGAVSAGSQYGPTQTVPVTANACALTAGTYAGSIQLYVVGRVSEVIPVTLTVTGSNPGNGCGSAEQDSVAAYVSPTSVSPGGTISVYGVNFDKNTYVGIDGPSGTLIQPSSITLISPNTLSFTVPSSLAAGAHGLAVAEQGGHWSLSNSTVSFTVATTATTASLGVQGYNPANDQYTNGTALANTYLVLYGSFGSSGNTVKIDGTTVAANNLTQSSSQINVLLTGIGVGSHTVSVSTPSGATNSASFSITSNQ